MPRRADHALRPRPRQRWRHALYVVIFLHDTRAGRSFDIGLMLLIVASVGVAMADSVPWLHAAHGRLFYGLEWAFTLLFTLEYALRLLCVRRPLAYATSFFGVIDLLTILPTYLSLFLPGTQSLIVIRALRLLRVFRVLRMPLFLTEAQFLADAMRKARRKIVVFLTAVLMIVVIVGTAMYLIEGPAHGFESIPTSVYWAIVTLTTVGYGDIAPTTTMGRFLAGAVMILGYGIIAVPAGVVTSEMIALKRGGSSDRNCPRCGLDSHDADARFCKQCGERLVD